MTHLLDKVTCHVIVEEICPFENCYLVPRLAQVPGSTFSWWTLHIRPFTCCCSVTKSCLTLRPHGLQHAQLLCPPLSPRVYSNSCPVILSKHLILCRPLLLLPSVFPSIRIFSSESALPAGGQSIGVSALASVLPLNIQGWFPLELTVWSTLLSKRLPRVFSSTTIQKCHFFNSRPSLWSNSHIQKWLLEKP